MDADVKDILRLMESQGWIRAAEAIRAHIERLDASRFEVVTERNNAEARVRELEGLLRDAPVVVLGSPQIAVGGFESLVSYYADEHDAMASLEGAVRIVPDVAIDAIQGGEAGDDRH